MCHYSGTWQNGIWQPLRMFAAILYHTVLSGSTIPHSLLIVAQDDALSTWGYNCSPGKSGSMQAKLPLRQHHQALTLVGKRAREGREKANLLQHFHMYVFEELKNNVPCAPKSRVH